MIEHRHYLHHGIAIDTVPTPGEPAPGTPPILLVHGGCHGAWCWSDWLIHLALRGYDARALNWLGRHGSTPDSAPTRRSIKDVAAVEVSRLVHAYPTPPVVIAHSMGAAAAMQYAAEHPAALAGLVLLAPVVPVGYGAAPMPVPVHPDRAWLPATPADARRLFWPETSLNTAIRRYALLTPESPEAVREATRFTLDINTGRIRCPVHVAIGTEDELVPPEAQQNLAADLKATVTTLHGQGHGIPTHPAWGRLAETLIGWITHNTRAPSAHP